MVNTPKKIYFASDVHLGAPTIKNHKEHEKRFIDWLDSIKATTRELYLLGDIFDFWYEYKHSIPKGFTRFLGKICEFTDNGIPVHFFTGNHDIWIFDYLPSETGIIVHKEPIVKEWDGKKFFLAHGDGLGKYDISYNFVKKVFTNPLAQKLFRLIHPDFGIGFAKRWSGHSRSKNQEAPESKILSEEKEWLILYAKEILHKQKIDFFIFGHRHLVKDMIINTTCRFIYLGDWVQHFTYGSWDGKNFKLEYFINKEK